MPFSSKFNSILYADDTVLILSDSNINSLINRVNNELNIIDLWLRKNKLSLNYSKTSFIIFNKQPNKTCDYEFKLKINNNLIKRVNSIKYLGVLIDSKLSWSEYVDYLNLQLARYSDVSLDCVDMSQMKSSACFITVLFILESNMVSYRGYSF